VELGVVANDHGEPVVLMNRIEPEPLSVVVNRRVHVANRERGDRPAQAGHERLRD
jgi:hypothetical protein